MAIPAKEARLQAAQAVVRKIVEEWGSPLLPRMSVPEATGGLFSDRYLSNLDSAGKGPSGMFYAGRKAIYPTDAFCDWLLTRITLEPEQVGKGGGQR